MRSVHRLFRICRWHIYDPARRVCPDLWAAKLDDRRQQRSGRCADNDFTTAVLLSFTLYTAELQVGAAGSYMPGGNRGPFHILARRAAGTRRDGGCIVAA